MDQDEKARPRIPDPALFRAAIHAISDGVSLATTDGRIIYSNPAADRILGVAATDAPPEEWADYYGVFLPEDKETPFPSDQYPLVEALEGRETDGVEMFVRNPVIPRGALISVTGRPVRDSHGDIIGAAVVFRDITRIRRAEEQKRELTGFLVHDMKSPLTTIMAASDLLLSGDSLDREDRDCLADIRTSAAKLHRMVLNLLDIQAAEDGRLEPEVEPVDPIDALESVVRELGVRAGERRFHIHGTVDQRKVLADPDLLRRILTNLLENCLKYGPETGRVWLRVEPSGGVRIRFSVSDEGPGVPPHLRDAIFEKYAKVERGNGRRDPSSRGLGLRFAKLAVEAHGGRIWVEDNDPVGARFCFDVPSA